MMSDESQKNIAQEKMEFFGAVTASISHEINNVFAIMNENSGLMSDLLKSAKRDHPADPKRILSINETLGKQIGRGKEIVKKLNRFAHSVDRQYMEVDVNEVMTNLSNIMQRFAYRKRAELTLSVKKPIAVETSPFALQHLVFQCLSAYLARAQEGDTLQIKVRKDSDGAVVLLYGPKLDAGPLFETLEPVISELSARTETESEGGKILIFLPRSANAG